MELIAEPLTEEKFAPFGHVLKLPENAGRMDYSGFLQNKRDDVPVCFRTSLTEPSSLPLKTEVMERHQYSSQAFLPVDSGRYLIMVAPHASGGGPEMSELRAFIANPDQGVSYNADTWHHPMTVLDKPSIFVTVMFADGGPDDEDWFDLPESVTIDVLSP